MPQHQPSATPTVGELFAGRYLIEALLGRGGMGSVYRAHDREVDERVALKTLDDCADESKALERFRREVRLARRVTHRNVARTYDLGAHAGLHFLTMEFIEGDSLRSFIARRPGPSACVDVALQIAAGLEAAHRAEIVHRDLKPGNVMIEANGRVVITDFGIARLSDGEHTQTGGLIGTPAYMAPEQVESKPVDARTDVYALGLIVVQMMTGALPFSGDNPIALAMARLAPGHPDLAGLGVPAPVLPALERALERDPDRRWPSAANFAAALEAVQDQLDEPTIVRASIVGGPIVSEDAPTQTTERPLPPRPTTTDRTGLRIPATTTTSASADARALAVLPFRYRGPADSDYVADALLDELTDLLSMTRGLKVSSSGASARLASAGERDPRALGAELGVDVVVDGTIQLAGKRLRIAARLLDVESGFQLWNERFDGLLEDVFDLQDKMGKRIAEALRVELQLLEQRKLADSEAIEHYLRARKAKVKWQLRGPTGAVAHYRAVLERVPDFRPAIAGLALACMRAWAIPEGDADEDIDWAGVAKQAVEQAMSEAPEFAETRVAAASWSVQGGYYREAAEHLREALRIAPTCALAHEYLGRLQLEAARPKQGLAHLELAYELDPGLDWCLIDIARYRALREDHAGYTELVDKFVRETENLHPGLQLMQMRVAAWRRDVDGIRAACGMITDRSASEGAQAIRLYGAPMLEPYDAAKLEAMHAQLRNTFAHGRLRTFFHQLYAEQLGFFGELEAAMGQLQAAADLALVDLDWLDRCPLFGEIREDPRFVALRGAVLTRSEQIWAAG